MHQDCTLEVGCALLDTMNFKLQKELENMVTYDMIIQLKKLFHEQARQERYNISKSLFGGKLADGISIVTHVLKMIRYNENLERLNYSLGHKLATDLIFQSS